MIQTQKMVILTRHQMQKQMLLLKMEKKHESLQTLKTVGLKFVQKESILETRVQRFHQNTMEEILGFNSIFQQHIMVKL